MALTLKLNNPLTGGPGLDMTKDSQIANGVATVAAGNYVANGLPIVWSAVKSADGLPFLPQSNSLTPYDATFHSDAGSGYEYQWDDVHGTLRIFLGGVELTAAAAIPGAVTGDTIAFKAWYTKA